MRLSRRGVAACHPPGGGGSGGGWPPGSCPPGGGWVVGGLICGIDVGGRTEGAGIDPCG